MNTPDEKNMLSSEISLKEFIAKCRELYRDLRKKWLLIFALSGAGALIGVLYASSQKLVYTASLTFALEDDKSGGGLSGALGLASSLGFDLGNNAGGAFSETNLIELIKSRHMVEKALLDTVSIGGNPTNLAQRYIELKGWKLSNPSKQLNGFFPKNQERGMFSRQQDSILGEIYRKVRQSNLSVMQKDKKVSIIMVEVRSTDEIFSKLFAETLIKEVTDFYVETRSKKAALNVQILARQVDSVRAELNNAISGAAIANDRAYNLNPALNVRRTPSMRRQVDVQANTVILTQLIANLELARVALRKETPLIQIVDKPIFPLEKYKPGRLISFILGGILGLIAGCSWIIVRKLVLSLA